MADQQLQWLVDMLVPAMEGARKRRVSIENEWMLNYRAWQGWPSQQYMLPLPDNAIHYFIPHARRAIERNVKRGTKLLMPNQDWHQTLPFDGESHQNAEAVHAAMRYIYQKKISTKRNISAGLRCLELYNFAVQQTSVKIQRDEVWPHQRVVDPFNFYIFPETAVDESDILILFEDTIIPLQVYKSFVRKDEKKSIYKDLDVDKLQAPVWPWHLIERLAYRGLSQPSDFMLGLDAGKSLHEVEMRTRLDSNRDAAKGTLNAQSGKFVSLSKVYFRLGSQWFYTVLCRNYRDTTTGAHNTKVVRLDETENVPLYRWCTTRHLPNELHLNSPMDDIRVLQNLTNNAISDVEANRTQVQSNPIAVNTQIAGRMQEMVWGTRKIWKVDGDPNELIKSIDVEDVSTNGIRAWQIYLGLLDKGSGGTLAEGQPGRNMPRAGFAAQNLLNMALVEIEDEADSFEQDVLTPGLGDVYHVILEYVPDKQLIKIPNKYPDLIKAYRKRDLYGDYSFTWLGSLGFQDTQGRADKFTQFLQILMNPQVFPIMMQNLQQKGLTLNLEGLLETIYTYGLGERNLGSLVIPMTDEQKQALNRPDPQVMMQQQEMQQKAQLEQMKAQQQMQLAQQKGQIELASKAADMKLKQAEVPLKVLDINLQRQKLMAAMLTPMGKDNNNGSRDNE